ncbi:D-cysteine desulfhydrase family protein [Bosea sp. 2KB_26]|uniref:D-cysteine desulfhydrase family protein n=1 Tax=Bosea sp. 2KB_26 TaxID=3237475 RepID=UPI003F906F58
MNKPWSLVERNRAPLAMLPTPLEALPRLTEELRRHGPGPSILIKRDDCTGLAGGGNKARKLEYLVGDALLQGADTLVTLGAIQSNHARQTAAAAARNGLGCVLLLTDKISGRSASYRANGNILLDRLLGADIRILSAEQDAMEALEQTLAALRAQGRRPYFIPIGGSNALGGLAYHDALTELVEQARDADRQIDHIVLATGSGGTHAGIVAGVQTLDLACAVHGISVSRQVEEARGIVAGLARGTLALVGSQSVADVSITIDATQIGPGYGQPTAAMLEAVTSVARLEGILLDPVYTGKAMAGLFALVRRGAFRSDETVVFWHTGGHQGLFAYEELFQDN